MKEDKFINKYLERLAKTIDNALDNNKEYILRKFVTEYSKNRKSKKSLWLLYNC